MNPSMGASLGVMGMQQTGYANQCKQPETPVSETEIIDGVTRVTDRIMFLGEMLDRLEARLHPVLAPQPPTATTTGIGPSKCTPLGGVVHGQADQLEALTSRLGMIINAVLL